MSSQEAKVVRADFNAGSGREWKASWELHVTEERPRERSILGAVETECAGLEFSHLFAWTRP